jgi:hypothetical protein
MLDQFRKLLTSAGRQELKKAEQARIGRWPTGAGKRELAQKERVPVELVANEVIYVNPAFPRLPFLVTMGKPTNLGVFAGKLDTKIRSSPEGKTAEGSLLHNRSLILGHVIFKDDTGQLYRDVDAKGVGYIALSNGTLAARPIAKGTSYQGMLGIFERSVAQMDASLAERFISLGIRTYRVIAIIKLKELVNDGKKYPIDEARALGIIPNKCEPVISIRAFGTRDRIADSDFEVPSPFHKSIEDARLMVAQELQRKPQKFKEGEYFHWFVDTLAENVARMHKARLVNNCLTKHNITLDCRIVDLDSVTPGPEISIPDIRELLRKQHGYEGQNPYVNDLKNAMKSIDFLYAGLAAEIPKGENYWSTDFENKYFQTLEKD